MKDVALFPDFKVKFYPQKKLFYSLQENAIKHGEKRFLFFVVKIFKFCFDFLFI